MAPALPRFLAGLGTGLAVLPLTIAFGVVANAGFTARWVVFLVLLAGGLTLGPLRRDRVIGYAAGVAATVAAAGAYGVYRFLQLVAHA